MDTNKLPLSDELQAIWARLDDLQQLTQIQSLEIEALRLRIKRLESDAQSEAQTKPLS